MNTKTTGIILEASYRLNCYNCDVQFPDRNEEGFVDAVELIAAAQESGWTSNHCPHCNDEWQPDPVYQSQYAHACGYHD
jgi:hypothetical protein